MESVHSFTRQTASHALRLAAFFVNLPVLRIPLLLTAHQRAEPGNRRAVQRHAYLGACPSDAGRPDTAALLKNRGEGNSGGNSGLAREGAER